MSPRDAAKQRRDIGMVFQHFNLFPHRTALENIIEAPIHVKRVKKDDAVARGKDLLRPGGAGGEGQRVSRRSSPAASSSAWRSRAPWR